MLLTITVEPVKDIDAHQLLRVVMDNLDHIQAVKEPLAEVATLYDDEGNVIGTLDIKEEQ